MKNICILAPYGFSPASLFYLYEVFKVSNYVKNPSSLNVTVHAPEKLMTSYLGTQHVFNDKLPSRIDVLIVSGSGGLSKEETFFNLEKSSQWVQKMIKKARASGALICSSCSASYYLAKAGLLKNRKATTSWWINPDFTKLFPDTEWDSQEILISHGKIITAGGSLSSFELSAELMGRLATVETRTQTDKILVLPTRRKDQKAYKITAQVDHPDVKKAYQFIHNNLSTCAVDDLVKHMGMSSRTLNRFCLRHLAMSPFQWIKEIRLQKARRLLDKTKSTVDEVALEVGYEDTTSFIRSFKKSFGISPSKYREFLIQHS